MEEADAIRYGINHMRKFSGGNLYVRICVLIADFLILNVLLFLSLNYVDAILIPPFFLRSTKVMVMVMNVSLAFSEYFFHTVIDRRFLLLREMVVNVLCLTSLQACAASFLLRILSTDGGLFPFMVTFFFVEFDVVLLSRLLELYVLRRMRRSGKNSRTVLFVGNDLSLVLLYQQFMQTPSVGYIVKGYYSDERMKDEPDGLMWLGNLEKLNNRLARWNRDIMHEPLIEEIFCSLSHDQEREVRLIMHACDRNIIHFYYVPRIFGNYELNLKPVRIGNNVFYSNRIEPLLTPGNRFYKRTFDIVVSFVVCLFLLPITLIVGLIIKIQSPGPIFFRQDRTGLDGKTFQVYKFRSMHVNKNADTEQATENDPRKFPFGDFMRRANIDELPQFLNVLKGDMSIVGPRPHMLHHTEMYGRLIDNYMVRLFVRPGITGWAQVTGFRGETKQLWQMEERVNRDIWYVEHWSPWLDIKIILMTAKSMFVHDDNAF